MCGICGPTKGAAERAERLVKVKRNHPSAAKAGTHFAAFAARLKSCPFKTSPEQSVFPQPLKSCPCYKTDRAASFSRKVLCLILDVCFPGFAGPPNHVKPCSSPPNLLCSPLTAFFSHRSPPAITMRTCTFRPAPGRTGWFCPHPTKSSRLRGGVKG